MPEKQMSGSYRKGKKKEVLQFQQPPRHLGLRLQKHVSQLQLSYLLRRVLQSSRNKCEDKEETFLGFIEIAIL